MRTISIRQARGVAEQLQADAVIVIAFRGGEYGTTSYGKDKKTCEQFARVCDQIHEDIADGTIPIPGVEM